MIFTKLILAHLIGDFLLQPNRWVAHKEAKKVASPYLFFHVLIHFALSLIVLWDIKLWWMAAAVAITHFIIDAAKLQFQKTNTKKYWFFADQILHIAVIAVLAGFSNQIDWQLLKDEKKLRFLGGLLFVTSPAAIIVKMLISSWTPAPQVENSFQTESLANAGKYIGMLERFLVFVFIYVNHWEGVGFMIAAKSIFRFSDLAEAKQRKLTEYVLIGTLLSFGLAIITALIVKQ